MRNNIAFLRTVLVSALCILVEASGRAGDLFLPPTDSICEGNAYITTQVEWDQFAADFAGCATFAGDITIDNSLAEIDSLYGLDSVSVMVGDLVVEYAGVPFVFNTLNSLDSLGGNLSISNCPEYFIGLNLLHTAEKITLNNISVANGASHQILDGLIQCETITVQGTNLIYSNAFHNLQFCRTIEFNVNDPSAGLFIILDSFSHLTASDSIIVQGEGTWVKDCFQSLVNADYIEIGGSLYMMGEISNSFNSLVSANEISLGTYFKPITSLNSLIEVHNITLLEYPDNPASTEPVLNSLERITGSAILVLNRREITFPALESAGSLYLETSSDQYNVGPASIHMPTLTEINGNLTISTISLILGQPDTSFHSFHAPLLTHVGGTITINAPALTSCISPAFCESANYSPNWGEISGGPGCSTVEEIQAQCVSICLDIDSNGICDSVQTVYIGDLEFTSTSEVQTFANAFPQVHKIIGDLTLLGYTGDALFETEALINLDTIKGQLQYDINEGIAFSGFSNLRHVDTFIGAYPFYNYGITYNENDSTPIYSYCTNCFPRLISANKMHILSADQFSFNALERCDTLNIDCSELNGAFPSLTQCKVLNINTNYFSSNQGSFFNPFNDNPYSLLNTILQQNEYACQSTIFSSFNQLDSINFLFATDAEISQSLNNIQHCRTIYVNNISTSESLMNLNSCENIYSNGNSSIMSCFDNITTLNTVGIYSSENTIDFPNLRELDFADFFLNDNSTLNLPLLDSIHYYAFIIKPSSFALNANINLSSLDYAQNLTFAFVQCTDLQLPSSWSCENLGIQNVQGLVSLNDISIVDPGYINITECSDFSVCSSPGLCEHISQYPERCFFANNAPGCSSIEEIQAQCLGSYASGTVYYDLDCDQQFNNGDALVSYPILLQGDTLPIGSSGAAGYFFVSLELNNTTTLFAQHSADWSSNGPITLTTTDSLQVFTDLQIGLCPVTIIHDVAVNVNASMDPRPGFTVRYNLVAQNLWPGSDSASVVFSTAQMPGAVITGYAAGGTQEGNQVSFTTNLQYGQSQTLWVDVLVPVGTPLGTAYTATASIALNDAQAIDSHPENNNYTLAQTVIGSYDPNDKLVTPAVVDLLDLDATGTELLEYTIRFQNTGTAEAIFVRVLDTLTQALNPATFQHIATSHPAEIIFHDNHVIEWFFDNIMLPDSFSNEPESHGFIQFRIQTLPLSEPFALENEAAIYFDFNEPVITPPAVTAVVICSEAGSVCDDEDACTTNDLIQTDCSCAGTFTDSDNDGICDAEDACDNTLAGTACDDEDPCTTNDLIQSDCSCAGTFADTDNDGICNANDLCQGAEPGSACNDNNPCTTNDVVLADCVCAGTFVGDSDNDGICNALDGCTGRPIAAQTPTNLTLACGQNIPSFDPGFYMTDGSAVSLTFNASQVTTGCTTTVIQNWIGTNTCNESTIVTRRIEFIDTEAPVLHTPINDYTIECSDPLPQPSLANLVVTDNCSEVTSSLTFINEGASGVYYYIYSFSDACGNTSSVTQTVRRTDSTPPTILFSGPTEYYLSCDTEIPEIIYSVTDNCDSDPSVFINETSFGTGCSQVITRQIIATDANGNTTTLTVIYNISDVSAPVFTYPSGTEYIEINCTDPWPVPVYSVTDNCDTSLDVSTTVSEISSGCETLLTVLVQATDDCGNTAGISFSYRRLDVEAPVFVSTPSTVYLSCGSTVPSFIEATDNCSEVTYASSSVSTPGGCTSSSNVIVSYTATDLCGNSVTIVVTYIFLDSASPAFVFIPEGGTYNCINDIPLEYPVAEDACSQVGLDYWDDITQLNVGFLLTRNWSATDVCGNTALTTVLYYTQFGEIGSRCDDGNPCTYNDVVQEDCSCAGIPQVPAFGSQTIQACGPYTWNGNTYSTSGTYTFATTTAAGCDSIAQLVLTVGAPTFTNQQATACNSYQWNGSVYTQSGTYTYVTTNASGCPNTATLNLTVLQTVVPTFNAVGPYCKGASIPALPTTSTNGITGTWSSAINNQTTTTYTFTPNANQCATTTTLTITINSLSTAPTGATASSTSVPGNAAVTLTVNGGSLGTGAQWRWYRGSCGGTLVGTGASISATVTATTTYFVRAEGSCNTTTCASVTVNVQTARCGPTAVNATSTAICSGTTTTLSVQGNTGTGGTWKWYSGSCGGTAVGAGASLTLSPTATTTYFVRSEGGSCGTTACLSITITVNTAPSIPQGIILPTNVCRNAPAVISILNPIAGLSYFWEVPNGWTITGGQGTSVLNVLVGQGNGQIRVYAFNGCGNSKRFIRSVSPINCSSQAFTTSDLGLELWPNPTSDRVFFAHGDLQPEQMQIYDILGRDLYSGGWLPEFDVSSLASGIYFVRVTSGEDSVVKRMEVVK